jgi:hypothetical protein
MNKPVFALGLLGVIPVLALFGCGSGSSTTPSNPQTPTPTTLAPAPTPTANPFLAQCGSPTPPALFGMKLKIHVDNGERKQLDSKPIVANVDGYCGKVGFGATVQYCETRPEGSVEREACDGLVVGKAKDTGRVGPTWTWNDKPCFAAGDTGGQPGCVNYPDNQFLIVARGPGNYLACASEDWPVAPPSSATAGDGGSRCGGWTVP